MYYIFIYTPTIVFLFTLLSAVIYREGLFFLKSLNNFNIISSNNYREKN